MGNTPYPAEADCLTLEDAEPVRGGNGLGPRAGVEFGEDGGDMVVDGPEGEDKA